MNKLVRVNSILVALVTLLIATVGYFLTSREAALARMQHVHTENTAAIKLLTYIVTEDHKRLEANEKAISNINKEIAKLRALVAELKTPR